MIASVPSRAYRHWLVRRLGPALKSFPPVAVTTDDGVDFAAFFVANADRVDSRARSIGASAPALTRPQGGRH